MRTELGLNHFFPPKTLLVDVFCTIEISVAPSLLLPFVEELLHPIPAAILSWSHLSSLLDPGSTLPLHPCRSLLVEARSFHCAASSQFLLVPKSQYVLT